MEPIDKRLLVVLAWAGFAPFADSQAYWRHLDSDRDVWLQVPFLSDPRRWCYCYPTIVGSRRIRRCALVETLIRWLIEGGPG